MTRFLRRAFAILALASLGGGACGGPGGLPSRTVVSIEGRDYTQADFDEFLNCCSAFGGEMDAASLSALLDDFVQEEMLVLAAERAGVDISGSELSAELARLRPTGAEPAEEDASPQQRDGVRRRMLVEKLLRERVLARLEVTEEELDLEFTAGEAYFRRPETVTVSEIVLENRVEAEAVVAALSASPAEESDDIAGDPAVGQPTLAPLGTFRRGELPEVVEATVFGLGDGEVSAVLETPAGFHVFRVEERLPARVLDRAEVEDAMRRTILERKGATEVNAYVARLASEFSVVVHVERLNFPYVGLLYGPE